MELSKLIYKRADIRNVDIMLETIHRCMKEVNYIDYNENEFEKYLGTFTENWLKNIKVKKMKCMQQKTINIRAPIGIPLPELNIEEIEQLDEDHMSLEYCYDLLLLAYQKSRELNDELEVLNKELRQDNYKLTYFCKLNGISIGELNYP